MRIVGDTLDDILHQVFVKLLKRNKRIVAHLGSMREHVGAHLILNNVRARFSRTERRATLFTCLGETLWYLAGSAELGFIEHHIPGYRDSLEVPLECDFTPGA